MREGRGTSGAFLPHKSGVNEELRYTQKPDVNGELRGGGARGGGRWSEGLEFFLGGTGRVINEGSKVRLRCLINDGDAKTDNAKRNGATNRGRDG